MKLEAMKFGIAAAIVSAIFVLISRLLLLAAPYGPMRAGGGGYAVPAYTHGGYMMHGYGGPMMGGFRYGHIYGLGWGGYFAGLVIAVIVVPLVAGVAAWATATVYNRLLDRTRPGAPEVPPAD